MNQYIITDKEIALSISGQNGPYTVSWSASFSGKQFIVNLTPSPELLGGIGETITLQLNDIERFKSEHLIPMFSPVTFSFEVEAFPVSESAESGSSGASYTFLITLGISLGISLLTGGSMELMWSLANTLQILFFIGLIDLNYSSDLQSVYEIMAYSNFDNPLTQYLSNFVIKSVNFIQTPVSSKFSALGFESTDIISNSLDKLVMIIGVFLLCIILAFVTWKLKDKESKLAKFVKKIDRSFRYESISRFLVELVLNMTVASLLNIVYGTQDDLFHVAAYICACLVLFGIFMLLIYTISYPMIFYNDIAEGEEDKHSRHKLLYEQFKKHKPKCILFYAFFIIRRM